jgi:acetyltransferase
MFIRQDRKRYTQDINRVRPWFKTRTGRTLRSRLIRHGDKEGLIDFFNRLSPEAKRRRFHTPLENPDPALLQERANYFVNVDNRTNGGAVLALYRDETGEHIVGVARLMRPDHQPNAPEAEAAIVVRDDFQGEGVATELLRRMVLLARQMKVKTILAEIEADNYPAIKLFRELDLPTESTTTHGETILRIAAPE